MKSMSLVGLFLITCIFHGPRNRKEILITQPNLFDEIKKDIEWFINKVKPGSVGKGEYNVYVAKIFKDEGGYCVTIGFLQDSLSVSYVSQFKYYTKINEELVLLDYGDDFKEEFGSENADIVRLVDQRIIAMKIYLDGIIIGTTPGYVCCYDGESSRKMYYENSDQIPSNRAIFRYTPKGELIELDSNSLKKIIQQD